MYTIQSVSYINNNVGDIYVNESDEIIPHLTEMVFDNHEDMFEFYKEYARKVGFPVQRRSRRMTDDEILRSVTFACAKGREHQSRTQNQTKPRGTSKSG
ncbi:hypothetical protein MKW92_040942 [Papaver armeniacum]|nr:hypothetical protein MKW92_040942 [Papaver armeniacum]